MQNVQDVISILANLGNMSKYIRTNFDKVLLLPSAIEDWIPDNHKARFVRDFVRELDLHAYNLIDSSDDVGRPKYHPEMLLMLWIYGYMNHIRSSRKIEEACYNDMGFIWLSGNCHPDHNTLSRFFKKNTNLFKKLFKSILLTAKKLGLIELALHALDGTKIASVISKKGASHRSSLEEKLKHFDLIIEDLILKTAQDNESIVEKTIAQELEDAKKSSSDIRAALQELDIEDTNHLNDKEPEARMMKCADGKTCFAYNCQAVRDESSGMVVAEEVVNDESDNAMLTAMIDVVKDNLGEVAEITLADGGYFAGRELESAKSKEYGVLVNMKGITDNCDNPEYSKFKFTYNAEEDTYTCPKDKTLKFSFNKNKKAKSGLDYKIKVYQCRDCKKCPAYGICTKSKTGRRINRLPDEDLIVSQIKLQSESGNKDKLKKRGSIIEPFFSIIKDSGLFRRFTCKNFDGAKRQWTMLCTTHNISVIYKLWQNSEISLPHFGLVMRQHV